MANNLPPNKHLHKHIIEGIKFAEYKQKYENILWNLDTDYRKCWFKIRFIYTVIFKNF